LRSRWQQEKVIRLQLRAPFSKPRSHEELFLEYYDWLRKWALQLSDGLREDADDLVHDLYVQLLRSRPNIDASDEDRTRGYLYKMLRNLGISKSRRDGRDALSSLLIVDYESVEYGLACVDRSQLILVRSDLARVCEYACIRRHKSRCASVLILRFFFGYYPSEIVRILQTTRVAIEKHLQAARLEARTYLADPGKLRFLGEDVTPTFAPHLPDEPLALFAELRTRIFTGTKSDCFPRRAIEIHYAEATPSMTVQELAHLVSCQECLERANQALGLQRLADRFPSDGADRDGGDDPPRSSAGGPPSEKLNKGIRQTHEHRPKKLQIAVDGEILAAQWVSSARSELQVKLESLAKPAFIEIFSEQGIRLAYLQLEDPIVADPEAAIATVELSEGRSLEVKLTFPGGIPVVSFFYYDPLLEEWSDPLPMPDFGVHGASPIIRKSFFGRSRALIERMLRSWFTSFESPWPLTLLTGVAALVLVFGLSVLFRETRTTQPALPTASALLMQSRQFEQASIGRGGAIHSTFALQTLSQDGKIFESQKVESWRSLAPNRTAYRLLDAKGRLIAGQWKDANGKVTRYPAKGGAPEDRADEGSPSANSVPVWQAVAQGISSSWLTGVEAQVQVKQESDGFDLRYGKDSKDPDTGITEADIVLNAGSSQLLRGAFTARTGAGTREYRFRNLTYEVVPAAQVLDSDFSPPSSSASLRSGPFGPAGSDGNTAHLMLEALELLSNLGPDVEQIVDVERTRAGGVEVNGVFPTAAQKVSVLRVFQLLRADGQVKLALHSGDEAGEAGDRRKPSQVESFSPIEVETEHIPFDAELRPALSSQGLSTHEIDDRIRDLASEAIRHSARMHREAWSICQIAANDFIGNELQSMPPEDKMLWLTLLQRHLRSFDQELEFMGSSLVALFPNENARLPASGTSISALHNVTELATVANALKQDADQLDRILTAGLALSPQGPPTSQDSEPIAPLFATLRTEETMLHGTVERLQTFKQAEVTK
jgi:RNA polymerase sigma factor (sigma-70 family)